MKDYPGIEQDGSVFRARRWIASKNGTIELGRYPFKQQAALAVKWFDTCRTANITESSSLNEMLQALGFDGRHVYVTCMRHYFGDLNELTIKDTDLSTFRIDEPHYAKVPKAQLYHIIKGLKQIKPSTPTDEPVNDQPSFEETSSNVSTPLQEYITIAVEKKAELQKDEKAILEQIKDLERLKTGLAKIQAQIAKYDNDIKVLQKVSIIERKEIT